MLVLLLPKNGIPSVEAGTGGEVPAAGGMAVGGPAMVVLPFPKNGIPSAGGGTGTAAPTACACWETAGRILEPRGQGATEGAGIAGTTGNTSSAGSGPPSKFIEKGDFSLRVFRVPPPSWAKDLGGAVDSKSLRKAVTSSGV